jgi:DNA-directed RNA polymerase specialized sigma24 family protein
VTAKEIRAVFRNLQLFREAARKENTHTIATPDGGSLALLDVEAILEPSGPLPDRTREAFLLSVVEDMPPEAVASDMGISKGTVAQLVNKALRIIEEKWSE